MTWMRALLLLLRYSGLLIGDAVRLARTGSRTGGGSCTRRRPARRSGARMNDFTPMNERFYFWSGASSRDGVARTYMNRLGKILALAGIKGGHTHRFRDTFAVELLLAGEPLERVLGPAGPQQHQSHRDTADSGASGPLIPVSSGPPFR